MYAYDLCKSNDRSIKKKTRKGAGMIFDITNNAGLESLSPDAQRILVHVIDEHSALLALILTRCMAVQEQSHNELRDMRITDMDLLKKLTKARIDKQPLIDEYLHGMTHIMRKAASVLSTLLDPEYGPILKKFMAQVQETEKRFIKELFQQFGIMWKFTAFPEHQQW